MADKRLQLLCETDTIVLLFDSLLTHGLVPTQRPNKLHDGNNDTPSVNSTLLGMNHVKLGPVEGNLSYISHNFPFDFTFVYKN